MVSAGTEKLMLSAAGMVLGRSIAAIAGGKLMCLQNIPEQTNESTNMFPHLFAPECPENT